MLLDLTDPDTPAGRLYSPESFAACRRLLNPGAAVVLHIGSPVFGPERVRATVDDRRRVPHGALLWPPHSAVRLLPGYGRRVGGLRPRVLTPSASDVAARLTVRGVGLRDYTVEVQGALFALPNYYRVLLNAARPA